ncbi:MULTISPECIES: LPS export ABC transporter periplasmic protein LptC [Legionella]|uniref:Lipopolysaccharide export system protein LptC n=1 Tax=Legionella maceachernii TaxID=466 RepID=A0A0W0W669_9GAMM|nr:LPS export ABC transporter periplasmic protein LptC [Legionella maceachernii]KTD27821.1 lipopolysaccharide export system protein LptC [Legionella maceachernii]SKA16660.1 lipopolysaccharide export system protein LptC [Legionella maceachernii]SUP01691.1 lipopolysaccharide exporter periplasmic protein [Legionella maceachernii]
MNAAKQAAWLFCLLVALACSGWYYASSRSVTRLDDTTLSNSPDMMITNLSVKQFDYNGKLTNFLLSPEVQHIPNNNMHFFASPRLALSEANQPAWEISAKQAQAIHGGERIIFTNDVLIHQNQGEHNQESTLKTEELTYLPKDKLATSETTVHFEQPGRTVHSEGIKVYLADKRVQLSQARATFEPKKDDA